jgi:hypothetical protein
MPAPYPYIYVNADGSARELHASERQYLETEFKGGDGAMPYINSTYEERNGWGDLNGYLKRSLLPDGTPTHNAPADDPIPADEPGAIRCVAARQGRGGGREQRRLGHLAGAPEGILKVKRCTGKFLAQVGAPHTGRKKGAVPAE